MSVDIKRKKEHNTHENAPVINIVKLSGLTTKFIEDT